MHYPSLFWWRHSSPHNLCQRFPQCSRRIRDSHLAPRSRPEKRNVIPAFFFCTPIPRCSCLISTFLYYYFSRQHIVEVEFCVPNSFFSLRFLFHNTSPMPPFPSLKHRIRVKSSQTEQSASKKTKTNWLLHGRYTYRGKGDVRVRTQSSRLI